MKNLIYVVLVIALISLVLAIISRLVLTPIMGIEANALLRFTDTLLLLALNLGLLQLLKPKTE